MRPPSTGRAPAIDNPRGGIARTFCQAIIIFCISSVLGHLLIERPYCWFGATFLGTLEPTAEVLINPLKPFFVYGIAMFFIDTCAAPLKHALCRRLDNAGQALDAFYILSIFMGMAGELIQGWLQNRPVNGVYPLWDVSGLPGNILGQAWIVNDVLFGIAITLAAWIIHPVCMRGLSRLSRRGTAVGAIGCLVLFIPLHLITYGIV